MEPNVVVMPCRHAMCNDCAKKIIQSRRRTCPFCNQRMQRIWQASFSPLASSLISSKGELNTKVATMLKQSAPARSPSAITPTQPHQQRSPLRNSSPSPSATTVSSTEPLPFTLPFSALQRLRDSPTIRSSSASPAFSFEPPPSSVTLAEPTPQLVSRELFPCPEGGPDFSPTPEEEDDCQGFPALWEMTDEGFTPMQFRLSSSPRFRLYVPRTLRLLDTNSAASTEGEKEEESLLTAALQEMSLTTSPLRAWAS